ncbi:hypothetical protein [Streptomonospora salina]|uniref:Uncharacterized protein n=1 Tax=Streptomonospora salina TaxID=104205 RepID=A0A841EB27_9ACTN|nr:hypothetical protein [Streptomonospora salina]MBB6000186.1 hypothetical protein [Streptomonospora salina]
MRTTDSIDVFLDRAVEAPMTLEQVLRCLNAGPGSAIAYHEHRGRPAYRIINPERIRRVPEPEAVIVWGHADLAEEMTTHRANGETMDDLLDALAYTAFDYLGDWYDQGPVPFAPIERVRAAMHTEDFLLDRRSDRWATDQTRIVRDHFVYWQAPYITATAKYAADAQGRPTRMLLRAWDLGRQIKGLVVNGDGADSQDHVDHLVATAKAHAWR